MKRQMPKLVTGGAGYIGSWLVKKLLSKGYDVRATVRNPHNQGKYGHLERLGRQSRGKLEIIKADLLKGGDFDQAAEGCDVIFHTASPFQVAKIKDPHRQLIRPALEGTTNVLEAANRSSTVTRVILTSSIVAVYGDASELAKGTSFDENSWNETSCISHRPYSYSKTVAEKKAWSMAQGSKSWDLVTINPGMVIGPPLSSRKDSTSVELLRKFATGQFKAGVPNLDAGFVDVRDVAKAHILAASTPNAQGRYIVVGANGNLDDIGAILRTHCGHIHQLPKGHLPRVLAFLVGPFMGMSWKVNRLNWGRPLRFDHSKSIQELGMDYRSLEESVIDSMNALNGDQMMIAEKLLV